MSQKSQSKSRKQKFFDIDKEAKKYYPDMGMSTHKRSSPMPVYVGQRMSRFEVRYKQMSA